MPKSSTAKNLFSKNFITGLLMGFLITMFMLLIVKPMLMPKPAVAPSDELQYVDY